MSDEVLNDLKDVRQELIIIGVNPITSDPDIWNQFSRDVIKMLQGVKLNIVCESDNQLFNYSLISDAASASLNDRVSFSTLKFQRDLMLREINGRTSEHQSWQLKISSILLDTYIIKCDEKIWFLPHKSGTSYLSDYKSVKKNDPLYQRLTDYIQALIDPAQQEKFTYTPEDELLELFDQDQIPRGIYPRKCFYDTDHYQFVVWGFIFSRSGEILIHQRSQTAKDNQGMWDKSIGGHVDFLVERSSNHTAVRELIEELFTDEKTPSAVGFLAPSDSNTYYLGDWIPNNLGAKYLDHAALIESPYDEGAEPWVYYKLPGTIEHNTPRLMPSGGERKLRVIADIYIFIANTSFSNKNLKNGNLNLHNSKYMIVEPSKLKSLADQEILPNGEEFRVTPDLAYVLSGKVREALDEVSQLIKYSSLRKSK